MDLDKCNALKADLADEDASQLVPIERFFDGNDDLASIGCNLPEHPGIDHFREVLVGLTKRPDVEAVYASITEADPDDDCWPFSDTVLVTGSIDIATLQDLVSTLEPDEVGPVVTELPSAITEKHKSPVYVIWWD